MNFNKNKFKKLELDSSLTKKKERIQIKRLHYKIKKCLGRDKHGQLSFTKGGGAKKKYRLLNTDNNLFDYRILNTVYDSYRSCFVNLIQFKTGELSFILNWSNRSKKIFKGRPSKLYKGLRLPLYSIPSKSIIYNLESKEGRAAGSSCKIFRKYENEVEIVLPSGKHKFVSLECKANIGIPSNVFFRFKKKYKAGNSRHLNIRPTVRGVAMNPVDHPHGGGEGKTSGGRPSTSPWGKLTKNVPTKKKKC